MPLSTFPATLDTFSNKTDGVDSILAAHINKVQDAVAALQANVGLTAKGSQADLSTRLGVALNSDGTLATGSVGTGQLAAGAVTAAKLAANTVTAAQIANNTITAAQIANNTVTAAQLANNTITAAQIANATIGTAQIASGGILPDNLGLTIWNATGSTLTAGQLVYVSGWNAANSLPQVSLAVNNTALTGAAYVVPASINNAASGGVRRHWTSSANLNTGGSTVGNPVYLDSTAGGWTLTQPTGATNRRQIVGRVTVVDAAVGVVDFDLDSNRGAVISTNDIQSNAVGTGQLSTTWGAVRQVIQVGTVAAAAGTTHILGFVPISGTVSAIKFTSKDALATSDINYLTIAGVEKGAAGSGVTAMTTGTAVSTTQTTGGQAISAFVPMSLGNAGVAVTAGDIIDWQLIVTGTLANPLTQCIISLTIVPNQ